MADIPLRLGTDEQFARLRQLLVDTGFTDDEALAAEEGDDPVRDTEVPADSSALEIIARVLADSHKVRREAMAKAVGADHVDNMMALGLITAEDGWLQATVRLRPMFSVWVVSDLWPEGGEASGNIADDAVMPADVSNTLKYLSYMPISPCERFLEMCGGSGIAALIAARRFAGHAYSYDITERATRFAEFSARLNGFANFTASAGDAYAPAGDLTFDRIVAHPPYVPSIKHTWIYHGGGADGQYITRKVVEGVPAHLAPGGRFVCRCLGVDRDNLSYEQLVRQWLGEKQGEFDVQLNALEGLNPIYYVVSSILRGRTDKAGMKHWEEAFKRERIVRFLPAVLTIQRRIGNRPVFTVRRDHGPRSSPREVEWLLQWETQRATGEAGRHVLSSRLRPGEMQLRSAHELENGSWSLKSQSLEARHPFLVSWPVEEWAPYVMSLADGKRTGADIHALLIAEEAIAPNVTAEDLAENLTELVSGGFLVVEGFEPPAPKAKA